MLRTFTLTTALCLLSLYVQGKTLYILGVDGLSYDAVVTAQKMGYLKSLKVPSVHIAPFPTMTDLSWSEVVRSSEVFGDSGKIKDVEAVHFNESTKSIEGDVRDYYRRLAQPKYYLSAFQNVFNPYVEALMYFPTKELPTKEIQTVFNGMLASENKEIVTGYIGAIDSTAHTQIDRLYPVIKELDLQLRKFIEKKNESGEDYEFIMISDHGNIGNFAEGDLEKALTPVEIAPVLQAAGLKSVSKLENQSDVAMPLLALGSWAPAYFKDRLLVPQLIKELLHHQWFDLSVQLIEKSDHRIIVMVTSENGVARIHYNKSGHYYYEILKGNPLDLPPEFYSNTQRSIPLTVDMIEKMSRSGNYPDSVIRLIESVKSDQFIFPDLIITVKDGYYINNSLGKMTSMFRTHGSLTRASSFGVVASSKRNLQPFFRSNQILSYLKVEPRKLYGSIAEDYAKTQKQVIKEIKDSEKNGIFTGAKEFSDKKIFQLITKIVSFSRVYFIINEIKDFMSSLKVNLNSTSGFSISHFDPSNLESKNIVNPIEIGELTDIVIRNPDINTLRKDAHVQSIVKKITGLSVNDVNNSNSGLQKQQTLAIKRTAMKMYQIPYLLDQTLTFQEKSYLPETRDLEFASYWEENKKKFNQSAKILNNVYDSKWTFWKKTNSESTAQRLFREVLKETEIEDRISPQPLNLIYKSTPQNTTVVYVPGTYNGIFDQEIFSLGLLSLQEELGLRVLKAPTMSACSSDYNGNILLNFLKEDRKKFSDLNEVPPRYLVLGYSKGAVDALHSLIIDKKFAQESIIGLAALAAPLKGSQILEKADLPFFLVNLLIDEKTPEICKTEKPATSSVSTQGMNKFWRKHEKELIGLTRYYSISFVSEPEESHLFMKITKMMAQFDEDNDGIVPVSSSKFPASLQAVDFGIIKADHLAGILSSRFNQRAFMRAIIKTLTEIDFEDFNLFESWKLRAIFDTASELNKNHHVLSVDPRTKTIRKMNVDNNVVLTPNVESISYNDPYELNSRLIGSQKDPLAFYEPMTKLLPNQLDFDPFQVLDLAKMPEILTTKKVTPVTLSHFKNGLDLSFNHRDVVHYRIDHQWMYESRSPVGADNNATWGFQSVQESDKSSVLAMRSSNNSIRLTTLAYRFKLSDFPFTEMAVKVNKGPIGADPVIGKGGKDDSAFQVWFTLRDLRGVTDRSLGSKNDTKIYTFGYYWGEEIPGENRIAGQVFENYYSNKNIIVATLPPAFIVVLNTGNENLKKMQLYQRNFLNDVKRAYPLLDPNQLEVLAITLQMDSNDTKSTSEAFLKTLKFMPAPDLGLDVQFPIKQ